MTERGWLIDKSALVRVANSPDVDEWNNRIERGLVHITPAGIATSTSLPRQRRSRFHGDRMSRNTAESNMAGYQ